MKGTELHELLGRLEETPASEPSAVFVAKLEADLRAMDQSSEATRPPRVRSRRARVLLAAGPVAALTAAAAAAAAITLLPSKPQPRELKTADPGVAAPVPPSETPLSSVPTPTTVVAPPWLPPSAAPTPGPTTTTVVAHGPASTPVAGPGEHSTPTVVQPQEPISTTVPPVTTTTAAGPETLSLHCAGAIVNGSPAVSCAWSASSSSSFAWYRLYREVPGSNRVLLFSSDMRTKTSYGDKTPQAGTTYNYQVVVTDSAGNVIGSSAVSTVNCC